MMPFELRSAMEVCKQLKEGGRREGSSKQTVRASRSMVRIYIPVQIRNVFKKVNEEVTLLSYNSEKLAGSSVRALSNCPPECASLRASVCFSCWLQSPTLESLTQAHSLKQQGQQL